MAAPVLDGVGAPVQMEMRWNVEGVSVDRTAALYSGESGRFLVVSHEHGPELYFAIIGAAGSAITVADGIRRFLNWCREQRRQTASGWQAARAVTVRRTYDRDGNLASEEVDLRLGPLEHDE